MHDPLDPRNEAAPSAEPRVPAQAEPSATDREVPLESRELPNVLHAYLDGEPVSESALAAAEKELALWQQINAEAGRRRRMMTPAHVQKQILNKLADD